jgi:hypothetical protein
MLGLKFKMRSVMAQVQEKLDTTSTPAADKGLIIFYSVEEAIKAERIIKKEGYVCKLVAPPPELRKGCDLAVEFNLVEQPAIERFLSSKVDCLGVYPLSGSAELLQIVKVTDYKDHIMVKAGNMKIAYTKDTGLIVNTSGGGCPDIPYLHLKLVGCKLQEAPRPKEIGFTLCALMLDRALEECLSLWKGGSECC